MEAKDIKWCPQHGYPLPCAKCGMPLSSIQQKELFKAGIKEVVDWVDEDLKYSSAWQEQKKKWGL